MKEFFKQHTKFISISAICFLSTCIAVFFILNQFPIKQGKSFEQQFNEAQASELVFRFSQKMIDFQSFDDAVSEWQNLMNLSFSPKIQGTIRPISEQEFSYVVYSIIPEDLTINFNQNILTNSELTINHIPITSSPYVFHGQQAEFINAYKDLYQPNSPIIIETSLPIKLRKLRKSLTLLKDNKKISFSLLYSIQTNYYPSTSIETNYRSIQVIPNYKDSDSSYKLIVDTRKITPNSRQGSITNTFEGIKQPQWLGFSTNPHNRPNTPQTFRATDNIWLIHNTPLSDIGEFTITTTPQVSNLTSEIMGGNIAINGDFVGNQKYTITLQTKNLEDIYNQAVNQQYTNEIFIEHATPNISQAKDVIFINRNTPIIPLQTINVTNIRATYQVIRSDHYTAVSMLGRAVPVPTYTTNFTLTNTPLDKIVWNEFNAQSLTSNRSVLLHINFQDADNPNSDTAFTKIFFTGSSLTAHVSSSALLFQALNLENQQPIEEMRITVWDPNRGSYQDLGKTTAEGTLHVPLPRLPAISISNPIFVGIFEEGDGDLTYTGQGSANFRGLDNKVFYSDENLLTGDIFNSEQTKSIMFTDRNTYTQGETLHVTMIARNTFKNKLNKRGTLFEQNIGLEITDPRGQLFTNIYRKFDSNGILSASIPLPESAPSGYYYISAKNTASRFSKNITFRVSGITPKIAELNISNAQMTYRYLENLDLSITPQFLFGGELHSKLEYSVTLIPKAYQSQNFPNHHFGSFSWQKNTASGNMILNKVSTKQQSITVSKKLLPIFPYNAQIYVSATANPKNLLPIQAYNNEGAVYFPIQLGLRSDKTNFHTLAPINIQAVAVDSLSDTLTNTKASLVITQKKPFPIKFLVKWFPTFKFFEKSVFKKSLALESTNLTFTPKEEGEYTATLSTMQYGQHTKTSFKFIVDTKQDRDDRLTIIANKREYKSGEQVMLEIHNPFPKARLLLTVEDGGLREFYINETSDPIIKSGIPLTSDDEPNINITAILTSIPKDSFATITNSNEYGDTIAGHISLPIQPRNKNLNISITNLKANYLPGETISFTINANSLGLQTNGQAIVIVRDRAVLTQQTIPDPLQEFYRPTPFGFSTWSNGRIIYAIQHLKQFMKSNIAVPLMARIADGLGRAVAPISTTKTVEIRSNIVYTPFYNANIPLYKDKDSEISFTLPDNASSFDISIIAVSGDELFGKTNSMFTTSKPLTIIPSFPEFVRPDDKVVWGATLYHRPDTKLENINITLNNAYSDYSTQIKPSSKDSQGVYTESIINEPSSQPWVITGFANNGINDGFSKIIPVLSYSPWISSTFSGILTGKTNLTIPVNSTNNQRVSVVVSSSPLEKINLMGIITNNSAYLENILNKIQIIIGNENLLAQYVDLTSDELHQIAQQNINLLVHYDRGRFLGDIPTNTSTEIAYLQIKTLEVLLLANRNNYIIPTNMLSKIQQKVLTYTNSPDPLTLVHAFSILSDLHLVTRDTFEYIYPTLPGSLDIQLAILDIMYKLSFPVVNIAQQTSKIQQLSTSSTVSYANISPLAAHFALKSTSDPLIARRIVNGLPNQNNYALANIEYAKKFPLTPFKSATALINNKKFSLSPKKNTAIKDINSKLQNIDITLESLDQNLFYRIIYEENNPTPMITNSGYTIAQTVMDDNQKEVSTLTQGKTYTVNLTITTSVPNNQQAEIIIPLYGGIALDEEAIIQNGNLHMFTNQKNIQYSFTARLKGMWTAPPISIRQVNSPEVFGLTSQPMITIK